MDLDLTPTFSRQPPIKSRTLNAPIKKSIEIKSIDITKRTFGQIKLNKSITSIKSISCKKKGSILKSAETETFPSPIFKKPAFQRQNNIALNNYSKIYELEHQPNPVVFRIKKKRAPKTLAPNCNGPTGKICSTDFWSDNMKREVLKMGRLDALESFSGTAPIEKAPSKKEIDFHFTLNDMFKNKLLSREIIEKDNTEYDTRRPKSTDLQRDISYIVNVCNDTRTENSKLRKDMSKTTMLLKKEFMSIMKKSSNKS